MTDDELAAIKSRVVRFTPAGDLRTMSPDLGAMTFDARTLLAEVEQWRAIGRRYIVGELASWVAGDGVDVREQARALLEGTQP